MAKEFILPFSELKGTLNDTPIEPTLEITENGVYNVKGYVYADVNVEGGGGTSDFSTANLTLINNTSNSYNALVIGCFVLSEELNVQTGFGDPSSESTVEAVIYKNSPSYASIPTRSNVLATATGNVRIISSADGGYTFEITGDGSITIADANSNDGK